MMRLIKVGSFIGLLSAIFLLLWYYAFSLDQESHKQITSQPTVFQELKIPERKSAIYSEEDLEARQNYERRMLIDPKTGSIPEDIHIKEIKFSEELPVKGVSKNSRQNALSWESLGPENFGGRSRAIVVDATDENVLISGSVSGGVFRSTDQGQNWVRTSPITSIQSVTAIAQDINDGNTNVWYYGTGELVGNTARGGAAPFRGDGIFKSVDGGQSWSQLEFTASGIESSFNDQFQYVWNMVVNPNVANEVYAAVFGGIAKSNDGGETWNIVLGDTLNNFEELVDLNQFNTPFYSDIQVSDDGVFYAFLSSSTENVVDNTLLLSRSGGVYRSTNGVVWDTISVAPFPFATRRVVIGIDPQDSDRVFFLTTGIGETGANLPQLWRYNHNSDSPWTDLTANIPDFGEPVGDFDIQNGYNMLVEVHPLDPDLVFIGAANLYASSSGFTQSDARWIGGYDPINDISLYPGSHPDQHSVTFFPSNPERMIAAHDGGLSVTENSTADSIIWNFINNGFVTTQYYTIALNSFEEDGVVLGGLQDNGTLLLPENGNVTDWIRVLGGDGSFADVSRGNIFYYLSFQNGQIFQINFNEDFGLADFARVDPIGGSGYLFINPFVIEPLNNNIMFLPAGTVVWRNNNLSQIPRRDNDPTSVNWERLDDTEVAQETITAIAASKNPRGRVIYGTIAGTLNRIDAALGSDYTVTNINSSEFPVGGYVTSISIDPRDSDKILVAFSNYNVQSIFSSEDGGETFIAVSGNLEENADGSGNGPSVRWLETTPLQNNGTLYFSGTSSGLFSTTELQGMGTVWEKEDPQVLGTSVVTMIKSRGADGKVVIGTHGNGVFAANIPNAEDIVIGQSDIDQGFRVSNPFPNPFIETTRIQYFVPEDGRVRVTVFDQTGKEVRRIFDGFQFAGNNEISWDGSTSGGFVNAGVYFYRVEYQSFSEIGRIVFVGG
ncbi:MAG: FlgD immunoglobulin-like domain containing protein [Bacteroidota bacterium]